MDIEIIAELDLISQPRTRSVCCLDPDPICIECGGRIYRFGCSESAQTPQFGIEGIRPDSY